MNYEIIIFDIDDTIIKYEPTERSAFIKTMQSFHLPYDDERAAKFRQVTHDYWVNMKMLETDTPYIQENYHKLYREFLDIRFQLWKDYTKEEFDVQAVSRYYMERFCKKEVYIGKIQETLRRLSRNADILIASNGLSEVQKPRLDQVSRYISKIYVSEDIGYIKPNPKFFEYILEDRKITNPRSVLMVGDNLTNDILGASRAGIDTCFVNPDNIDVGDVAVTMEVEQADELSGILL